MSRLAAGEIAPGIAARAAAKRASVAARLEALQTALDANMAGGAQDVGDVFKRFGTRDTCAEWSDPHRGISPLSVKTLMKYLAEAGVDFTDLQSEINKCAAREVGQGAGSDANPGHGGEAEAADGLLLMTAQYLDLLERMNRLRGRLEEVDEALLSHFKIYSDSSKGRPRLTVVK